MSEQKKQSRLLSVFTKEYKHEGLILLVLSLISIVLGVLILTNGWLDNSEVFLIGDYPEVFSWILIVLGVFAFVLAVYPFYKPSIEEVKRVSWPTKTVMLKNTLTVFLFVLIMAVFFGLADSLLRLVVDLLDKLAEAVR